MKISTDGRCPKCGSYKVSAQLSPRQFSCADCAEKYIRLTGAAALHWRKTHPDAPGIFVDAPDATRAGSCATPGSAGPRCRLCGKHVSEVRCYFQRVNAKGVVPALWECRPSCGATMSNGEAILAAIESPNAQGSATREAPR